MFLRTLLDRYIFTELLSPFSVSLGALCFVMLTRELLRLVELLVSKGVGIVAVLQVFANLMQNSLRYTDAPGKISIARSMRLTKSASG